MWSLNLDSVNNAYVVVFILISIMTSKRISSAQLPLLPDSCNKKLTLLDRYLQISVDSFNENSEDLKKYIVTLKQAFK